MTSSNSDRLDQTPQDTQRTVSLTVLRLPPVLSDKVSGFGFLEVTQILRLGIANAVGLAIGQAHMGATFNKDGFPLVDNYTYVFLGDGCLQEGVSSEACSLAG